MFCSAYEGHIYILYTCYIQAHCNISLDLPSPYHLLFCVLIHGQFCEPVGTLRHNTKYSKSILNSGYLNGLFQRLLTSNIIENCTHRDTYLGTRTHWTTPPKVPEPLDVNSTNTTNLLTSLALEEHIYVWRKHWVESVDGFRNLVSTK